MRPLMIIVFLATIVQIYDAAGLEDTRGSYLKKKEFFS